MRAANFMRLFGFARTRTAEISPSRVAGSSKSMGRGRAITYWCTTLVLATECVVGGVMGGFRMEPFFGISGHLGYPPYFMTLLGVGYVLAGFAMLAPGVPRLKEWAYAGLIFNYTGALTSHLAVGDGPGALIGPILFAGLTLTSWALRPADRRDLVPRSAESAPMTIDVAQASSATRARYDGLRSIGYWVTTSVVAAEMLAGSMWDLLGTDYVRSILNHLGYPLYLLFILGVWKLPCAVTLLIPRGARLKEWAYAGAFFNYAGAAGSHLSVGDSAQQWAVPAIFALITFASWALRPHGRRYPA